MGGFGSTRWSGRSVKQTTSGIKGIDIRVLTRQGSLVPGNEGIYTWTQSGKKSGQVAFAVKSDKLVLDYQFSIGKGPKENVRDSIPVTTTPCNYGGVRQWFKCPSCGRRICVVYAAGKYFRCRHCYDLTYESQHESLHDRLMERARSIRVRLGGSVNLFEPFPPKPKRMRWKTYNRLRYISEAANNDSIMMMAQTLGIPT